MPSGAGAGTHRHLSSYGPGQLSQPPTLSLLRASLPTNDPAPTRPGFPAPGRVRKNVRENRRLATR
ncbi:hypothetical protein FKP32DRAFT_1594199 [Trametes sanguinea]|nr:hypothetical protein FKP32DRAFT_1594199 [Trametes sanguinea]